MSTIALPPIRPSSAHWPRRAASPVLAAVEDGRPPPQSAGRGFRVLRALISLGVHSEHQLADIARAAGLQPSHTSKLLKAASLEHLVEHGVRRGTYRLTHDGQLLIDPGATAATTPKVRQIVEHLQEETGLAAAWHEPHWRPGLGLHLNLVDLSCPHPELHAAAAQQEDALQATAAGRAALAFLPAALAADGENRALVLPPAARDAIRSSRIAVHRGPAMSTLATPVLRGQHLIAVLSATGPHHHYQEPLRAQEYAVLLRRAASRAAAPAARPPRASHHTSSPHRPIPQPSAPRTPHP
ncbi:hypothetical protein [Streptomyces nigrescens]|uniref:hypothetical protein n=1 Tax=Streptomyces nigrescens TaxID=1920 RepID=UPI0036FECD7A